MIWVNLSIIWNGARPVGDISSSFSVYATNDPDDVNSWVKVRHNSMIYQATNANGIRSGNTDYRYYCFHIDATWNSASYVLLPDSYASDVKFKVISNGYDLDPKQNTLTVDGGEWGGTIPGTNQTRNWNEGIDVSAANAELVGKGPFARNDDNSQGLDYVYGFNNGHAVITFDPPLPFNKLQFRGLIGNVSPVCEFRVNGTHFNSITVSSAVNNIPITTYDGSETELRQILLYSTSNSAISALLQVIVDDEILLMPSTGATKVEYETLGGQGEIISVNTDNKTLLIKDLNSNTRDNRWIAENKADTEFYVAGPEKVDRPLLTTNVWLESSAFSTTPATDADGAPLDALKTITWSIKPDGGDEMIQTAGPSGTSNPYQPTGLTLNTWHTIKVKHEGLLLGESIGPWSTSTRFQTGASRSLKEHYVTQIRELEQQLAAAQGTKTRSVDDGKRKRARNADGTYKGDDPSTPDVNEAWEDG